MPPLAKLLLAEGLAVGALVNSGVAFVSTYQNPLQRAVVGILTVICALRNGTFDALVCMAAHSQFLLFVDSAIVFPQFQEKNKGNVSHFSTGSRLFSSGELTFRTRLCIIFRENLKLRNLYPRTNNVF
jgi:hypothetical protein